MEIEDQAHLARWLLVRKEQQHVEEVSRVRNEELMRQERAKVSAKEEHKGLFIDTWA